MPKPWPDLGLWFIGVGVTIVGAACPIYLFSTEGFDSIFGDVIYVLAGILLFLAGLGITFFRVWRMDQEPASETPPKPLPRNERANA